MKHILILMVLICYQITYSDFQWFDPDSKTSIPKLLSGTGLFDDMETKSLTSNATAYEVNTPLWSDGAIKQRYIILPAGNKVEFVSDGDLYEYPDKTVFVKNFLLPTGSSGGGDLKYLETRLMMLVKTDDGGTTSETWYGFSYKWRSDQSDADLVSRRGESVSEPQKWSFPAQWECMECHIGSNYDGNGSKARAILGFFTAQLNRPSSENEGMNQLQDLYQKGVFQSEPGDPNTLPSWASIDDSSASLEKRAMSYLASNCSGCHGKRGIDAGAGWGEFNLDYHQEKIGTDSRWLGTSFNMVDVDSTYGIVPGRPDKSIYLLRQIARNEKEGEFRPDLDQMPPLGVYQKDTVALEVLSDWINSLDCIGGELSKEDVPDEWKEHCGIEKATIKNQASLHQSPHLTSNHLYFPGEFSEKFELRDVSGNNIMIRKETKTSFQIPVHLAPGVYFLTTKQKNHVFILP